mgnify:CR=1 FL=1
MQVERLATVNNLLTEAAATTHEIPEDPAIKVEILTDLISNFKEIIKEKNHNKALMDARPI